MNLFIFFFVVGTWSGAAVSGHEPPTKMFVFRWISIEWIFAHEVEHIVNLRIFGKHRPADERYFI